MRLGIKNDDIQAVTMYDPWFIERIREIVDTEESIRKTGLPSSAEDLAKFKNVRVY
jgi:carbamoyl-phosphate synthase large subunit